MLPSACLLIVLIPLCECFSKKEIKSNKHFESKIVGGTHVTRDRFPSAVQFFNAGNLCAGSILNSYSVLTAAHCFDVNTEMDDMVVQVGARFLYDRQARVHDVLSFVIHEDYNKATLFACDIALLFLSSPIKFGNKTKKAVLVNNGKWMNTAERHFKATGWGQVEYGGPVSEKGLMMTNLRFVPSKRCSRLHKVNMTADMFCLYGEGVTDTCKGDSGGGILWNDLVVGVTSHGDGCAKKDKPSVYSNVWYFRNWIQKNIKLFVKTFCE
ncbi:hypothetical protein evm_006561 [Chilo suppressalis]|nr:hypothetical protein evm_006561 [Chilo suppressalis]